jgi:hypothetical protein
MCRVFSASICPPKLLQLGKVTLLQLHVPPDAALSLSMYSLICSVLPCANLTNSRKVYQKLF